VGAGAGAGAGTGASVGARSGSASGTTREYGGGEAGGILQRRQVGSLRQRISSE